MSKPTAQPAAAPQGAPAPPPTGPAVHTTSLKVLRSHPGYAHQPGETVTDLDAEQAQALVNGGFVQVLTTDITNAETR